MKRKSIFILIICVVILVITGIEITEKYPEKIEDNVIDIVDDKLDVGDDELKVVDDKLDNELDDKLEDKLGDKIIDEDVKILIFDDENEFAALDEYLNTKADELFGIDYCKKSLYKSKHGTDADFEDKDHPLIAGAALTDYTCKLCKVTRTNSNTAVPEICADCALATNRCMMCGKKLIQKNSSIKEKSWK